MMYAAAIMNPKPVRTRAPAKPYSPVRRATRRTPCTTVANAGKPAAAANAALTFNARAPWSAPENCADREAERSRDQNASDWMAAYDAFHCVFQLTGFAGGF